jgi:hypothetical protein
MAGNAGLPCIGIRLEKDSSLDPNLFKRQRSYADNRRRPLEFEEGDHVYLKMSPLRGMRRFKVKGKLSPRFIGPFELLGELERWPINSSYMIIYLMCIMYSMCLNVRSVSVSLRNSYQWKSSVLREVWLIQSTLSRFLAP